MGGYRHWGIFILEVLEVGFDDFGDGHFGIKGGSQLVVICCCCCGERVWRTGSHQWSVDGQRNEMEGMLIETSEDLQSTSQYGNCAELQSGLTSDIVSIQKAAHNRQKNMENIVSRVEMDAL